MAISITLALNGWIGWHESAAIVMGENIGTTVTAWLASLGASANAKRAARAHFIFNVFGVVWMLILFYPFTGLVETISGNLFETLKTEKQTTELAFRLAIFHTMFNFTNIALLIGFSPFIAKMVTKWVKEPGIGEKRNLGTGTSVVAESMVESGIISIPQGKSLLSDLSLATRETVDLALDALQNPDLAGAKLPKIEELELQTDQIMTRAHKQLSRAARGRLSEGDAKLASAMARAASEFEEVADHAVRVVQRLHEGAVPDPLVLETVVTPLNHTLEAAYAAAAGTDIRSDSKKNADATEAARLKADLATETAMEGATDIHVGVKNIALHHHLARMAAHARHVVKALAPEDS